MTIDYTRLIEQLDPERDGEDTLKPRTAIVDEVNSDGTLDIILSGVIIPNVPRLASVGAIEGDAVQVQASRGALLVIGTIASVSTPHLPSVGNLNTTGPTGSNDDTTSASFANMAGTGAVTSFSFTKRYAASAVWLDITAWMFSATSASDTEVAVQIDGVDYAIIEVAVALNVHVPVNGHRKITGITFGVKTVQARWRRSAGSGTLRRNAGDWLSITAMEVSA
jgi:hypothetical protein